MQSAFKQIGSKDTEKVVVTAPYVDIYLPGEYHGSQYRGTQYFEVFGKEIRFFGMGLMKIFSSEKEHDNPVGVKAHPFAIPAIINSTPDSYRIVEIQVTKDVKPSKWIIITFSKDSVIFNTTTAIKSLACMNMLLSRLEGGKLSYLEPGVVVQAIRDSEVLNGVALKTPTEELEIYVGECFRDPLNPSRKYRYTDCTDPSKMISYNMRETAMQSTTYQAITHEDISNSLVSASNHHKAGILYEPTTMEKIVRGMPLDEEKASSMSKK